MELHHIEAFAAIAEHGGFSRAARYLHLSQPAISRRVQVLEEEVGIPLFDRRKTGVTMNEAGRAFLPHAQALLAAMRDGVEAVRAIAGGNHGTITFAIVGTLASTDLTGRLCSFRLRHPHVDLRLRTALSAQVSELVLRGDAALGLRYGKDTQPYLLSSHVYDEEMVVICSPKHRLARIRRVTGQSLASERWLAFPPGLAIASEPYISTLEKWLVSYGISSPEIIPIDSLTAQKRMVEAGFGLALLPKSSIEEEVRNCSLHVVKIASVPSIPVVLIRRRGAFLSGASRALMQLLSEPRRPLLAAVEKDNRT